MVDSDLVQKLRQMARSGTSVCDMVVFINDKLRMGRDPRMLVMMHLRAAFGLGIADLSPVGAWSIFPGGTWSREEVETYVMPLILRNRQTWDA